MGLDHFPKRLFFLGSLSLVWFVNSSPEQLVRWE